MDNCHNMPRPDGYPSDEITILSTDSSHNMPRPDGYPSNDGAILSIDNRHNMPRPDGYPSDEGTTLSIDNRHEMPRPDGYPSHEETIRFPFLGTYNDLSLLESGLYGQNSSHMSGNDHAIQEKMGKSIDPRFLMLLEFFRQLYIQRQELFHRMFPGIQDQFEELSKKIGTMLPQVKSDQMKYRSLQRSLSVGSPRPFSNKGDESPLTLKRFKVRTLVVDDDEQGGGQGQGDTKSGGSK